MKLELESCHRRAHNSCHLKQSEIESQMNVRARALSSFSRAQLSDPMDYSPPGSSAHGILQAKILEWVAMPSSRDLPHAGIKPLSHVSCIGRWVLYHQHHLGSSDECISTYIHTHTQRSCMKTDGSNMHIFNVFNTTKEMLEKQVTDDKD